VAKKKKRPSRKASPSRSPQQRDALNEAHALLHRRQWAEARDLLDDMARRWPREPEVLFLLLSVHQQLRDPVRTLSVAERLAPLVPRNPDVVLALAGAYLDNNFPALALRAFEDFLARWPDHPQAADARRAVTQLTADIDRMLETFELGGPEGRELAAMHEEVQCLLARGRYAETRAKAAELLRRRPRFAAALNNSGEASFREGRFAEAVAAAEEVLGFDPENFHALSNRTRYLCLSGRVAEARAAADRLKAARSSNLDLGVKKAEALSYLGDDRGVWEAWEAARLGGEGSSSAHAALFAHLAAVAAFRLGREDEARRLWRTALERMPGLDAARDNLDDLDRPPGERNAPWPFRVNHWLPESTARDLAFQMEASLRRHSDRAVTEAAQRFLRAHPELASLAPLLLDHGDGAGREMVLRLAHAARTPELLAPLRDFALGQRGTDELRMQAAQLAADAGLLPPGPIRFWSRGEWTEVLLLGFEIFTEPRDEHSPEVTELAAEAIEANRGGDGPHAEELLRRALAIEPESPSLQNNLAVALQAQGRDQEAEDLIRQIHARFPDYLFARAALAQQHTRDGEFDEARELLKPLLTRRRLHYTEFNALCAAQIDLLLGQGEREGARVWFEMWEGANPDNPLLEAWRARVGAKRRRR
jgi:tetratricopeptide (TPR) repeat protein